MKEKNERTQKYVELELEQMDRKTKLAAKNAKDKQKTSIADMRCSALEHIFLGRNICMECRAQWPMHETAGETMRAGFACCNGTFPLKCHVFSHDMTHELMTDLQFASICRVFTM